MAAALFEGFDGLHIVDELRDLEETLPNIRFLSEDYIERLRECGMNEHADVWRHGVDELGTAMLRLRAAFDKSGEMMPVDTLFRAVMRIYSAGAALKAVMQDPQVRRACKPE